MPERERSPKLVLGTPPVSLTEARSGSPAATRRGRLHSKNLSGYISVSSGYINVNRERRDFLQKLEREADVVRNRLGRAARHRSLKVRGVLVFTGDEPRIKFQPKRSTVAHVDSVVDELLALEPRLSVYEMDDLVKAAEASATWRLTPPTR